MQEELLPADTAGTLDDLCQQGVAGVAVGAVRPRLEAERQGDDSLDHSAQVDRLVVALARIGILDARLVPQQVTHGDPLRRLPARGELRLEEVGERVAQ